MCIRDRTQILQGDRRFDFVVRYKPEYRRTPEEIRNILLPTPEGNRCLLYTSTLPTAPKSRGFKASWHLTVNSSL